MENLTIVEYQAQRVLTTEQLAQAYECDTENIKKNFQNNKERFVEGKHYFKLTGEALKEFKIAGENNSLTISPMTRTLYLWTKRGASRHCKMLGTDKAWDMFDILEENYFDVRPAINTAPYIVIPKFFRGHQVLTIKDVAAILNTTRSVIEDLINRPTANLHEGTDYLRLKGEKRAEFKRENPSIASCVHNIIAILESGFNKICNYFGLKKIPAVFALKVKEMSATVQETSMQVKEYIYPEIQIIQDILETQKSIEEYTNLRIMLCRDYDELRREAQNEEDGEAMYGSFLDSMATMIDFIGAILTVKRLKLKDLHF